MNKKISVIITSVCLVALIVVGSTLAFFTSQGEVNNVITMGNVKIALKEPNYKDSGYVVPGQKIVKDPTVLNVGGHDAYIRCKLEVTGEKLNADAKQALIAGIAFEKGWVLSKKDGCYYYQQKLSPNQSTRFFNSVTIPQTWDNDFANQKFHINVTAEAIQTDNFTPQTTDGTIDAWNYSGGGAVSVQP